jgi:hypothetical protein
MNEDLQSAALHTGSCHCGAVRFEVRAALQPALRCNCSLCRRRGALMSPTFETEQLRIVQGEDQLAVYQFNTGVARHFFCKQCGIYPFHQTRKDKRLWRVNLGCVDGIDAYALENSVFDGASLSVAEDA